MLIKKDLQVLQQRNGEYCIFLVFFLLLSAKHFELNKN